MKTGKIKSFLNKHAYTEEPHCGDCLAVCKFCGMKAWLRDDIKHKKDCELNGVLTELNTAIEAAKRA